MMMTTTKNEIQVLLEEFLGKRKAASVAESIYAVMHAETKYTHNNGKEFFITEDSNGKLTFSMESKVKENVEGILSQNLEKCEIQECIEKLIGESVSNISNQKEMTEGVQTIVVEGSNHQFYASLSRYPASTEKEKEFIRNLKDAIESKISSFEVPIYNPEVDEDGDIFFVEGGTFMRNFSYNDVQEIADNNKLHLGTKKQYILYLATIIQYLIKDGWSKYKAIDRVCNGSGIFIDEIISKNNSKTSTISKILVSEALGFSKIVASDKKYSGYWVFGGRKINNDPIPLAGCTLNNDYNCCHNFLSDCIDTTPWFVF